jgi:hypothetical protein
MLASAGGGLALMAINLRKARTIEDTPTAKIRSAAQGYVSVSGIARTIDDDMVIAPLTGRPCLWYHYTIERRDRDDNGTRWTTIERGTSEKFFALDDTTGICHIDPRRAEVTTAISQRWEGDERQPVIVPRGSQSTFSLPRAYDLLSIPLFFAPLFSTYRFSRRSFSTSYSLFSKQYRYSENRIHAQEWIYALGWFETLHAPSLIERTDAQTKLLLNQWKQDRDSLLARFDRNRDGEIDLNEWERARTAARQQAQQEVSHEATAPAVNTMSRSPLGDQAFLIATRDPRDMASKYRVNAFTSLAAGFGFAVFILWKFYLH